ncbi:hypothetical protein GT037_010255, partial [Alternaria burnsii]
GHAASAARAIERRNGSKSWCYGLESGSVLAAHTRSRSSVAMAELVSLGARETIRWRDDATITLFAQGKWLAISDAGFPESTRQTRPPAKAMDLVVPLRNTQDLHCPDANLER